MTFPDADVQVSKDTSPPKEASPNPWWDFISSSPLQAHGAFWDLGEGAL